MKWFYIEATSYSPVDGELVACWTTEAVGQTCPNDMDRAAILWSMWRAGWRLRLRRRDRPGERTTFVPPPVPIWQWAREYVARAHPVDPAEGSGS